ncbi:MAG TPA: excinuclease ABC subunit UvrC [Candidatus Polarisedimenticolaceae bacterium]|nr:excinuclease ABC subunit UvrC [Candidatus Polarisedimenticolaceae bacterium]
MPLEERRAALSRKLDDLPDRPGVYLYRNAEGKLLYVGKAKSLRSRVRSYFQPSVQHPPRTARLVSEVADVEFVIVNTELEALILESNFIKRERPTFNVLLRDDKNFPYLKLSLEDTYPRVSLVRRAKLDRNVYYGPFIPASTARRSLKLIPQFFQVATCHEVFDGKRRPCLYYHLGQCLAPCAGKTNPEEYGRAVADAKLFLEGRHHDLEASLKSKMRQAADALEYERASRYRDTLRTVSRVAVRQNIASVGLEDQDYLAHHAEGREAALQVFEMRAGHIQARREFTFDDIDFEPGAFYAQVLLQLYADVPPPPEIYIPALPGDAGALAAWLTARRGGRVALKVPGRGTKKRFLDLVAKNAALAFEARFRARHSHGVVALEALAEVLGLEEPPQRIECFDVSNIQGTDSLASMVVWENGQPKKSDYRTFNIKTVKGPDDFASIGEAVTRRYTRLLAEGRRMPDLVLIDGGAGQLGAAVRAMAAEGLPTLPIVALAKREEEIYLQGAGEPVRLPRSSPALQLLQRIRDEAHRFGVTRHRRKRTKRTLTTALLDVPGIGKATARKLLRAFGSVEGVRGAGFEEWARVAGRRAAAAIARWVAP